MKVFMEIVGNESKKGEKNNNNVIEQILKTLDVFLLDADFTKPSIVEHLIYLRHEALDFKMLDVIINLYDSKHTLN